MARQTDTKKGPAAPKSNGPTRILKDERIRIIIGVFCIGFAVLLFLGCLSFLFTWKGDQSFENSDLLTPAEITVENWAGRVGARLSTALISHGFGIGAFFFPFLMFIIGCRLINIRLVRIGSAIRITCFGAILCSLLCSFLFGNTGGYIEYGLGGAYGLFMVHWLDLVIGHAGAGILIFMLCFIFLMLSFKRFLPWFSNQSVRARRWADNRRSKREKNLPDNTPIEIENESVTQNPPVMTDSLPDDLPDEPEGPADEPAVPEDELSPFVDEEPETTAPDPMPEDIPLTDAPDSSSDADNVKLTITAPTSEETAQVMNDTILKTLDPYDPTLDLPHYQMPTIDLLEDYAGSSSISQDELIFNKNKIVETLAYYKIKIMEISVTPGPTVTLYEIVPSPETRIARIKSLENDIAMRLKALGVRIIAPIPGKGTIGIEVPNKNPEIVSMKSLITSRRFQESTADIAIAIGKTISNETFVFDLAKMPHLLVAGSTGQGKSVGLNAIITSILYKKHPAELKFVLVDPKTVEFSPYDKIERHFLAKLPDAEEAIITDTQKVIYTIKSLCIEMDTRYNLLKDAGVRNIKEYNRKYTERKLNPEEGHRFLPYIVVIIDEFSDLIMTAGKEIEMPIARLAQKARAAGMHLIVATQRPTTNIITGTIKANFPARIAFKVTSQIDSRTILDAAGAEQLIGRGDLLFTSGGEMTRVQCGFIDIPEIEEITSFIGNQPGYPSAFILPEYENEDGETVTKDKETDLTKRDALFDEAARLMVLHQRGSTSLIQRKFRIGYARAGCIMDQLEMAGIVGPFEGSKARKVLFMDEGQLEQYLQSL